MRVVVFSEELKRREEEKRDRKAVVRVLEESMERLFSFEEELKKVENTQIDPFGRVRDMEEAM